MSEINIIDNKGSGMAPKKTVVVTGAFGFIGVYLIDALIKEGYHVVATGHRTQAAEYFKRLSVEYYHLDLCNVDDIKKLPQENVFAVINLAGLLPANVKDCSPADYIQINILGILNLLEYCKSKGIEKFLTTTSYADVQNSWSVLPPVADDVHRNFRYSGDHAMYVISKNAAVDCLLHYNKEYSLQGVAFRLPPVYGYGPHLSIFEDGRFRKSGFQIFLEKALSAEPIEIWGDRNILRDVVYVKDVVQAFLKALSSERALGVYNITSGKGITLEDQALAMIEVFSPIGRHSEIVYQPEIPNGLLPYVFSVDKAKNHFGYCPQYSILEMLKDFKLEMESGRYEALVQSRRKFPDNDVNRSGVGI